MSSLVSCLSLRNTEPTWNSLASLLGLPSGSVCVCVGGKKKHSWREGGKCVAWWLFRFTSLSLKVIGFSVVCWYEREACRCPDVFSWRGEQGFAWALRVPVAQLFKSSLDVEQRKEKQESCPRGVTLLVWMGSKFRTVSCPFLEMTRNASTWLQQPMMSFAQEMTASLPTNYGTCTFLHHIPQAWRLCLRHCLLSHMNDLWRLLFLCLHCFDHMLSCWLG